MRIYVETNTKTIQHAINNLPDASEYMQELAADAVVNGAKARVPVDTGLLKSQIYKEKQGRGWAIIAGTHYSGFVEFGTVKMAAQPYMRPALEAVGWGTIIAAFFKRLGL